MIIQIENVYFIRNENEILKNINLYLDQKSYVLIGPNGSGKTTLLSILTGLEWPTIGKSLFIDKSTKSFTAHKKNEFAFFFPKLVSWIDSYHPDLSVVEVICTGFYHQLANYTDPTDEQIQIAENLLDKYIPSLSHIYKNRSFSLLSTGEKYRTLLLRSLVSKPKILVLDEPFDGLDLKGRLEFENIIYQVYCEIEMLFLVLHRIEEIPFFIQNAILIKEGSINKYGNIDKILTSKNLSYIYDLDLEIEKRNNRFYVFIKN